ncbi:nitroreductase family deazaflavin-dependent oxidoreductase [Haliangium sp.]|uniref:nitroreductase family deazaflavin-dependent oxidoreductase n=1 Tax=Haliangium sp. TaxID=2663208 RepID=UPI003D143572
MAADERFLYLTTTGRRSGLPRRIEIWFVDHDGRYYLVSEHRERSHWVQNLRVEPAVSFSVGTRADGEDSIPMTPARARVVSAEAEPELAAKVTALMDAKYGWSDGLIVELSPAR